MVLCKPDLTSRQELYGLASGALDIRKALVECALLDTPLLGNDHFITAMKALSTAATEIHHLRAIASSDPLSTFEDRCGDLNSIISRL